MALHGMIEINGTPIGWWSARRKDVLLDPAQISTYECVVETIREHTLNELVKTEFELKHRYSDGAVGLLAKVTAKAAKAAK